MMQNSDWWKIGTLALKTPLERWHLLLRCLPGAGFIYLVLVGMSFAVSEDSWLKQWPVDDFAILPLLWEVPALMLKWVWMNALWHGNDSRALASPRTPMFWQFFGLFFLVDLAYQAFFWLVDFARAKMADFASVADHMPVIGTFAMTLVPFIIFGLFLFAMWISVRLVIWSAVVIDRRRIVGPDVIWHLTRGYDGLIFMAFLVVIFVAGGAAAITSAMIGQFDIPDTDILWHLHPISILSRVYGIAAMSAATLLVYRRILDGPIAVGASPKAE
ncbi:MAG: hypothetical protein JNL25_14475 [Rhodospirillaceae bacterium]|nr:hypothetical protein [Rhodospirillaceae bacterium]